MRHRQWPSVYLVGLVCVLLLAAMFAVVALAAPHWEDGSSPGDAPVIGPGIEVDVDLDRRHKATPGPCKTAVRKAEPVPRRTR